MRDWLNQNSAAVTVGAVAVILIALAVIINGGLPGGGEAEAGDAEAKSFYYDSVSKKVFITDNRVPPIKSPDGNEAWRVRMYSCGTCDAQNRFPGLFEKYPDDVKPLAEMPENWDNDEVTSRLLVSIDGKNWYPVASPQAAQLHVALQRRCQSKGGALIGCSAEGAEEDMIEE